jgi:error-prone DNA polymerase
VVSPGQDAARSSICLLAAEVRPEDTARRIVDGRPWASMEDLVRRAGVSRAQLESLATAGALRFLPDHDGQNARRGLLWGAGAAAQANPDRLPGVVSGAGQPVLPEPSAFEDVADDLWSLGMTPDRTAIELVRSELKERGVVPAADLSVLSSERRVSVAGVVTHRQQPESARGAVF